MDFLLLFIIPILVPSLAFIFLNKTITVKEFLLHIGIQAVVASLSLVIIYYSDTSDTETWSGVIIKKDKEIVSCEHTYQCNCHRSCSGSKSNRSCTNICSVCYYHVFDIDWTYYSTDNDRSTVSRVDSQGTRIPPSWNNISVGDPSASLHTYTNYIKGSTSTLFKSQGLKGNYLPILKDLKYPNKVYDYYKINRFITHGFSMPNSKDWNMEIMNLNKKLGFSKQVNVIVVLVKDIDHDFFNAIEEHWLGGKKNDLIVVAGVDALDDRAVIKWTDVMTWSKTEDIKIAIRNSFIDLKEIKFNSPGVVTEIIERNILDKYERKPMSDFEYLKKSIRPSPFALGISLLIGLLISIGLTILWHKKDIIR
jgi:hypothetical protein